MGRDARGDYDALVEELVETSSAKSGQMFGMPCLKYQGKFFAGYAEKAETMVFKLTGEAHSQALALEGARLFDPSGMGRPMKEWVEVPHEHASRWGELAREALDYCVVSNA